MIKPIRLLYVDDNSFDRDLVRDALAREPGRFQVWEAACWQEFESLLENNDFDLVLSDFRILGFNGLMVMDAVHNKYPHLPVVIVTGTGSEEVAVEAMKKGAADYVIKSAKHIQRLPQAISTALEQKSLREERQRLFEYSIDLLSVAGFDGSFKQLNPAWERTLGWTNRELMSKPYLEYIHPDDRESTSQAWQQLKNGELLLSFENRFQSKNGDYRWISWNSYPMVAEELIFAVARDITEAKNAQVQIQQQLNQLLALRAIDTAIISSFDLQMTLTILLEHVIKQLKVDAAAIVLCDPKSQTLRYSNGIGFHTDISKLDAFRTGQTNAGVVALEERVVYIPDLRRETDHSPMVSFAQNEGFTCYYAVPLLIAGRVMGVLEIYHRAQLNLTKEWLSFFNAFAGQAAIAIDSAMLLHDLQQSNAELLSAYDATIEGWSRALDLRDKETEGHTRRVTEMTLHLARLFDLSEKEMTYIRWGALLHDIGKLGVPDRILFKPDVLSEEEWIMMKKHPAFAYEMLSPIQYLHSAIDIPYCHHEKWDGTGYPRGLKGDEIPLAARIFSVTDVYDALTSDRPYRAAWSSEKAVEGIKASTGSYFDPIIVELFLNLIKDRNSTD